LVRVAGDWEDAAGTLESEPWDLFMADPAPAALDFTGMILDLHDRFPVLPIILITSFARHEREIQRVRPVCRHIFEKPVDVGAVDRALQEVFAA
jgi:DNA-binding NtrC family response regulator